MTDMFSREHRSRIMSRIRSQGNVATELRFIEIMRKQRITGWRRGMKLPGQPDFVFRRERVVVFIDGDFWHGNPRNFRLPLSHIEYWTEKISSNKRRDQRVNRLLRARDWSVIRFWQSALKNEEAVVSRLTKGLRAKKTQRRDAHNNQLQRTALTRRR